MHTETSPGCGRAESSAGSVAWSHRYPQDGQREARIFITASARARDPLDHARGAVQPWNLG